jgi:hypothetical protein
MTTTKPSRIDWRQHQLVRQCERVDTTRMLMIADAYQLLRERYDDDIITELLVVPVQGGVVAVDRLHEADRVFRYWPDDLLVMAMLSDAAWNSLAEPARWPDVARDDVVRVVYEWLDTKGRWPLIDDLRRRFGRNPTNRVGGRVEGQGSLAV